MFRFRINFYFLNLKFIGILILTLNLSCVKVDKYENELLNGTFEIVQEEKVVCRIYRFGDYQLEEYKSTDNYVSKVVWISDTECYLYGTEKNPVGIDTVYFKCNYIKKDLNNYDLSIFPVNSNVNYKFQATVIKLSNELPQSIKNLLAEHNKGNTATTKDDI